MLHVHWHIVSTDGDVAGGQLASAGGTVNQVMMMMMITT